jgi:hypothetical protein
MSVQLSPCECCSGYIVRCDKCNTDSAKCSNALEVDAIRFAIKHKGFKTYYPTATSPAQLLCETCYRQSGMPTMLLKKYAELGTVHRCEPCQEYPGEWLVMIPENVGPCWTRFWFSEERSHGGHSHQSFDDALQIAKKFLDYLENEKIEYNPTKISVAWKCTDNDPRIGQVWFTGFYQHGKFNFFGDYRAT